MENKNLYEILGIKPDASKDEIKIAYRKLVRVYHPDVNKTKEAETYFKMLNNAVETLLDDTKRLQYDLAAGLLGNKKRGVENSRNTNFKNSKNKGVGAGQNSPINEGVQGFWDDKTGKSSTLQGFYNDKSFKNQAEKQSYMGDTPQNSQSSPKMDGADIETVVNITKTEQKQGTTRKINVLHTDKCPKCLGRKYFNGTVCSLCKGVGEKSDHKVMSVKIPAGIKDGAKLKIKGEGEYGKFGGANGDLYLIIRVGSVNDSKDEENKITIEASISPSLAVLGGETEINAGGKYVKIKIPPLTKSMSSFKLNDIADSLYLSGLKADYTVIFKVDIPENPSKKELNLYKKLRELELGKNL